MTKFKSIPLLILMMASTSLAHAQSYSLSEDAALCDGWVDRANLTGAMFLEHPDYEAKDREYYSKIMPQGHKKYIAQAEAFLKSYKLVDEPNKEYWENDSTYIPRVKNDRLVKKIVYYDNHGAGFHAEVHLNPNVDIEKLKTYIETRDNYKLKTYNVEQLKLLGALRNQLENYNQSDNQRMYEKTKALINKTYPDLSMTSTESQNIKNLKTTSVGVKIIKGQEPGLLYASYIGIKEYKGASAGKYLVCGIGNDQYASTF